MIHFFYYTMTRIWKWLILIVLFQLVGLKAEAQSNCFFTHYSSRDGLSQNAVMSILQDHKGAMWFATWDGINRFNGYTFTTYKASKGSMIALTNNRVDHMYEDKYGFLWLHTYDNTAHRFDPQTETFEQVPDSEEGTNLKLSSIRVLSNGVVWLLTNGEGAVRVTTDPVTHETHSESFNSHSTFLSTNIFHEVFVDSDGNEWVLTDNGIGYFISGTSKERIAYFSDGKNDADRISQPFFSVAENENELLFGSENGRLWRYQKADKRFFLLELPTSSNISSISPLPSGEILVATLDNGFFVHNHVSQTSIHYSHAKLPTLPKEPILSTYVDKESEVWFEQENPGSVFHFNPITKVGKLERLRIEPTSVDRNRPSFHIHEDAFGVLWVHPFGGGMSYYNRAEQTLKPFYNDPDAYNWHFSNKLHSAFSDRQGNLWMGTHAKGLEKVTFKRKPFFMETPYPDLNESLSNEVRGLWEDDLGQKWVAFKNGVLRLYNRQKEYIGYLTEEGKVAKQGKPVAGVAYNIMQDRKGVFWISTKGDGIIRAERSADASNTYTLKRFVHNSKDVYSLSSNNVYSMHEDANGRIWAATFDGGLNYIEPTDSGQVNFINHRNHLKGYPIDKCYRARFVTSDSKGRIWVGTTSGALCFDGNFKQPEDIVFHHFLRIPGDKNSLGNNDVHWIIENEAHDIYLATFGGGLSKVISLDESGKASFKSYDIGDGLPSDMLLAICEDHINQLWISTEHGISKFDPKTERFENFDDKNFSFRVRFSEATSIITEDGDICFGASNGVFSFHPDSIYKSSYIPPIQFSSLSIVNNEVTPGEHSILKNSLDNTTQIVLTHKENIIGIQFAALDYTDPENIQYAYILEGLDKHWTYTSKLRSATYTHLPKGKYVFKVRSTNSDGAWVENTRALSIEILPAFWETSWAYVLYTVFIILFIFIAAYVMFTIYRLKHEVTVEQQVSDIKLRFFTNISHELRTPLTLIAGPVEHVLQRKDLPGEVREQLRVVERNTDRMLRLINQILDFRKIQNKRMKMQVRRVNIVPFVRKVMENFDSMAAEHHFDFVFETEQNNLYLWVDEDKLEKILFNLLSNAFKYTPSGKMIAVYIREDENTASIEVRDQGIGIEESKKGSIFERFENLVDKSLFNHSNSGIGLSLVKELVEMHKAQISVDSKIGEGSRFKVDFPKGKTHFEPNTDFILNDSEAEDAPDGAIAIENMEQEEALMINEANDSRHLMLLVEDNIELRSFLRNIFISKFNVVEAENGNDGYEKAVKLQPDIIISDLMMPEKDGFALLKEIRENVTTSHIPIVLLTAKSAIESKLAALESGADDYITKPFSAVYLEARVDNLLTQRSKLRGLFKDSLLSGVHIPEIIEEEAYDETADLPKMTTLDRKFMDKLMELMEKNMDNGGLVVDDFVAELAVSRSVFFKKLKSLTGLAPIEFIKEMRIKRAAELIDTGEFNMTQIAYMVGINDPRYFSKCFKQKYNMTPTEYRDRQGEKTKGSN